MLEENHSASPPAGRAGAPLLIAVALLSASGLMFEVTLTRLFSATIWYHYTFVAISVALFGWGLGGFLVCVLRLARFEREMTGMLGALSLLVAATFPLFLALLLQVGFSPRNLVWYFLLSLLPFLAGGAALSLAFESRGRDSNRLYFADLLGAAAGTLLVPLALSCLGAETTILAIGVLPGIAGAVLLAPRAGARSSWRLLAALVPLAAVLFAAWNLKSGALAVRDAPHKELYQLLAAHPGQARVDSDRWNAYSRITAVSGFDELHIARLFIDSSAETSVLRWNGSADDPPGAASWLRAFPFRMKRDARVLVIGPGGGTDVVLAIAGGCRTVTAVEMNPLIVDCVRRLGGAAGNLYDHPRVELVMEEGRNFIERTSERFDLIVLGWVDSWASVASGGLALTENYLYTQEALAAYTDHLTEDGALAIIRWPIDVRRLAANAVAFLGARGLSPREVGRRVLAASLRRPEADELSTVETVFLLARAPLLPEKVGELLAGHEDAYVMHAPGRASAPPWDALFSGEMTLAAYGEAFDTLATPVCDDHPFYFAWDKPLGIPRFVVRLLLVPVGAVVAFALVLLLGARRLGFRAPRRRSVAYFGALGMGFIIVEVALMQRLILLLGHPLYSLVVILFTLLVCGGIGSLCARRVPAEGVRRALGFIVPFVVLLVLAGAFALPGVVRALLPLSLPARVLLAGLLVLPFGFLMGMPFPLGLRHEAADPGGAPLSALWGVNGVASVIGSLCGLSLALIAGFTWVFVLGAGCYAVAWLARPASRLFGSEPEGRGGEGE